jgi:3-deoxy-D-manno-octulosonic-acid transferase
LHSQLVNGLLPLGALEDWGQLSQVLMFEAPSVGEYVSAAHLMQVLRETAPAVVEYIPEAQFTQASAV